MLDLDTVIRPIALRAAELLEADTSAVFLEAADGIVHADRRARRRGRGDHGRRDRPRRGHDRRPRRSRRRRSHQRRERGSACGDDPGRCRESRGAPDGGAARRPRPRDGDDGGLAHGAQRPVQRGGPELPRRAVAAGRDRDRERAAVPRGAGCARGRRAGERREERVPGRDEPRDPHADERDHRDERPAPGDAARRRAAGLRRHDREQRRVPARDHQRHPRLLEDRGRPDGARTSAVRPAGRASSRWSTSSARWPRRRASSWRTASRRTPRRPPWATSAACVRSCSTC